MDMQAIGARLKEARTARGYSQRELAKKIGVSHGIIQNIEYNKVKGIQGLVVTGLCEALDINRQWFLDGVGKMDRDVTSEIYSVVSALDSDDQDKVLKFAKSLL